ncbi:MAG: DUF2062 domain-containing protein [Nitrospinota bacterium]
MFKRKTPPSLARNARMLMWPTSGFKRAGKYILHRLARLPDSPDSIAAGLACGVAVSMTPLLGLHFALAALLAWLLGGNILASAIGTFFGSPWTFPFIWYFTFKLGSFFLGMDSGRLPAELSFSILLEHPGKILLPMLVGSILPAIISGFLTFFAAKWVVIKYQDLRSKKHSSNSKRKKANLNKRAKV